MKFVFIDEFKPQEIVGSVSYGLSAVVIDLSFYQKFKIGFYQAFTKLGWTLDKELKGRYVYSKKVFENIDQVQRITFAKELFALSSSRSGKSSVIKVIIAVDLFEKTKSESQIYTELLCKICKKIGKPASKKQGKNIVSFYLDNNDAVTKNVKEIQMNQLIADSLHKDWVVFEKAFFVESSNIVPGIIYSDFVSYFHQNYFDTSIFLESNKKRLRELFEINENNMTPSQMGELEKYLIGYRKKKGSKEILDILKKIDYV